MTGNRRITSLMSVEAGMPRFIGRKTPMIYWELLALAVLILVILIVIDVTTSAEIF